MDKIKVDFSKLEKALLSLEEALIPPPANTRERDGAIQRFEYTFELTWKTAKRILLNVGIETDSPKSVIRELGRAGWVTNPELWMDFLDARNKTSHNYEELISDQVFSLVPFFAQEARQLLEVLRSKAGP